MWQTFRGGINTAVTLPRRAALELVAKGTVKIGWMECPVKEKIELQSCYKCWGHGHVATNCPNQGMRDSCRKCLKSGHHAKDCTNEPACPDCRKAGYRGARPDAPSSGSYSWRLGGKRSHQQMIKLLQVNVNRSPRAHDLVHAAAMRGNIDVLLVQEPKRKQGSRWVTDQRADAAILILNKNLRVTKVEAGRGAVTVTIEDRLQLASVYVSPNSGINAFKEAVDEIMDRTHRGGDKYVITGDLNVKAAEWGGSITDPRGSYLLEWMAQRWS